jgi:L-alanine-DL-glutamate epimerase-like enolase superfamily enzyme
MRIRDIRVAGLKGATPKGGWSDELQPDDVVHTLIAVHTDEGVVGMGSVFTAESLVRGSLEVLSPLVLGENALEPERVTEKLHRATFWLGRGGAVTHTIGGIDIALWDILGKVAGQPVGRLLGGRWRERVTAYASVLMDEPSRMRQTLSPLAEKGFRAVKIGWGPFGRSSSTLDEAIIAAARESVGTASALMVDAGASDGLWQQDLKWARRTADMLAGYDVKWFEEPLPPDAMRDFVALRSMSTMLISGGEVFTRRQSFTPWIEAGALDIVQPDVTKVGGLSEQRRIAWLAEEHNLRVVPHGWNTAVGLASDLQFASAIRGTDMVEYLDGSPYIDELVAVPWKLDAEGMLNIPDTPGLGLTLDEEAVNRYTGGASLLRP